ncbi:MAG TPA: carbamoyltransferase C-terminal domain-containing protein [Acidimicrobiales bacterium]|nr:carbamoyltransferase C-terminal domain-containing protein [Acidimicrobiales bacterium]
MQVVLGVNCFSHDTAAALLVDGALVAFVEEERVNREVHTRRFPHRAIDSVLRQGGVDIGDVDIVAFAHRAGTDLARGGLDALRRGAPKRLATQAYVDARLARRERTFRRHWGYTGEVVNVGHHLAHASSTFYAGPFDTAAVLTMDRGGDFLCTTMNAGRGTTLEVLRQVRNPNSLGEVYTAVTRHIGFHPNDEGKVMGLAPYGSAKLVDDMRELIRLEPDGGYQVDYSWFGYPREGAPVSKKFVERFGPARQPESELTEQAKDLAYAVQDLIEETALHVARGLRAKSPTAKLCMAGGLVLNSVMNERIYREAGFDDVFIQPAAGDAGNALGAALWVWHNRLGQPRTWQMEHAYYGESWSDADCAAALRRAGLSFRQVADRGAEAADRLAEGKVVGWFQGRAEAGPRALGARSILADPRRDDMRDIVNAKVKRREWFRPFAPSVLHEHGPEWFEGYHPAPFMLTVLPIRTDKRSVVPAVTHVDGTGRVQSVTREQNEAFHDVISKFNDRTGVPIVLNTSFNLRGEPMVHRPSEAINDYLRSEMDSLVLGPFVVDKVAR